MLTLVTLMVDHGMTHRHMCRIERSSRKPLSTRRRHGGSRWSWQRLRWSSLDLGWLPRPMATRRHSPQDGGHTRNSHPRTVIKQFSDQQKIVGGFSALSTHLVRKVRVHQDSFPASHRSRAEPKRHLRPAAASGLSSLLLHPPRPAETFSASPAARATLSTASAMSANLGSTRNGAADPFYVFKECVRLGRHAPCRLSFPQSLTLAMCPQRAGQQGLGRAPRVRAVARDPGRARVTRRQGTAGAHHPYVSCSRLLLSCRLVSPRASC